MALRATQKNHKTKNEDIAPWLNFLSDILIKQAEKAKKLIEKEQPEKLLSEKQTEIYQLLEKGGTLSVLEIDKALRGKIPQATIKQSLSRLLELKLLERLGQGRATRYRNRKI